MRKLPFMLVAALLLAGLPAQATPATRYLVKGAADRDGLEARHEFAQGFTADLTAAQAARLRAQGAELEPMVIYMPLAKPEARGKPGTSVRPTPADQVPWGVELVSGTALPSGGLDFTGSMPGSAAP